MTVTLTANYKETLQPETIAELERLCEDGSYYLEDALIFIDEHSEVAFVEHYEEYIEIGEKWNFDAIDAFITLHGFGQLDRFENAYIGEFSRPEYMAEEYLEDDIPYGVVVDWESTAVYLLEHDVDRVGDFYFRTYF